MIVPPIPLTDMPFMKTSISLVRTFHVTLFFCSVAFVCATETRADPLAHLRSHLQREDPGDIASQPFATTPLDREQAEAARDLLSKHRLARISKSRRDEMKSKVLSHGDQEMPFFFKRFGKRPQEGWSLYISMHGGGGTAPQVNDRQWENQKRLYQLKEGIYVAPRAPTNTWNLWHQAHIDPLFDRLIENMVAIEGVDRNRVYLLGYSAGGDGVYQLAPRMSDRFAAAAMMAGHPNETSPIGLRNLPFALQVGGRDSGFNRNKVAAKWKDSLAELRQEDPNGYQHFVKIYPDKGHWMDLEDAVAIEWMSKHKRNPTPSRIVWKQDDVTHNRLYWLAVDDEHKKPRSEIVAAVEGQLIQVDSKDVAQVTVYLDDRLIDLDKPVRIESSGKLLYEGNPKRTIATLSQTIHERNDPDLSFPAKVTVTLQTDEAKN